MQVKNLTNQSTIVGKVPCVKLHIRVERESIRGRVNQPWVHLQNVVCSREGRGERPMNVVPPLRDNTNNVKVNALRSKKAKKLGLEHSDSIYKEPFCDPHD